ncbi:hypothetical protein L6452_28230 [Arctium lappa]|uniref:Uncharacterized protein n=1 Tax=Arctium lappa TaxID=4217 RepID=A0ACB8ZY56_ARCLA|nr:hypothetical protein L6452_28230 [Arctium lappa]
MRRLTATTVVEVKTVIMIRRLSHIVEAYDALDPNGNITIKWDIISWTPDGYVVKGRNYPLSSSHILHTSAHLYAVLVASISPSPDRGGYEFTFAGTTEENKLPYHAYGVIVDALTNFPAVALGYLTMDMAEDFKETFGRTTPNDSRVFLLVWHVVHLILRVLYLARDILSTIESYLITNGLLEVYKHLNLDRVKYLGVVIDSDEARQTSEVIELLEWLSAIGIKKVCLYDREGVLKKSKEVLVERFSSAKLSNDDSKTDPIHSKKQMDFEFVSVSDGKEAVAKAANVLFKKYYLDGDTEKPFFTETYLTDALKTLGAVEPDPDLLLIYGPARCHLGFPAWRIRYTEMVHMGPLKYKKYGLILKAIHKFTKVKQNYGS